MGLRSMAPGSMLMLPWYAITQEILGVSEKRKKEIMKTRGDLIDLRGTRIFGQTLQLEGCETIRRSGPCLPEKTSCWHVEESHRKRKLAT